MPLTLAGPDHQLIVIARDDDTTFGILHSRFHELWSLRLGTSLEDRPRYTPSTTFETFPFPAGLTPNVPAASYAADLRAIAIVEFRITYEDLQLMRENTPEGRGGRLIVCLKAWVEENQDRQLAILDAFGVFVSDAGDTRIEHRLPL